MDTCEVAKLCMSLKHEKATKQLIVIEYTFERYPGNGSCTSKLGKKLFFLFYLQLPFNITRTVKYSVVFSSSNGDVYIYGGSTDARYMKFSPLTEKWSNDGFQYGSRATSILCSAQVWPQSNNFIQLHLRNVCQRLKNEPFTTTSCRKKLLLSLTLTWSVISCRNIFAVMWLLAR